MCVTVIVSVMEFFVFMHVGCLVLPQPSGTVTLSPDPCHYGKVLGFNLANGQEATADKAQHAHITSCTCACMPMPSKVEPASHDVQSNRIVQLPNTV